MLRLPVVGAGAPGWGGRPPPTTAMGVLAGSVTAMNVLSAQSVARNAINAKASALAVIQGKSMAIGKFAIGCAGKTPSAYADIAAVVSDTAAMSAIYNSKIARQAIEGSSIACAELEKVATVVTPKTDPYLYNGKCFVIAISQHWSYPDAGKYTNTIGSFVDSPVSRVLDVHDLYNNYNFKLYRFASRVEILNSTWGGSATGHWNGAKVVKIN